MKICKKCGNRIPAKIVIDGRQRNLCNRNYCLVCTPFGSHNTRSLVIGLDADRKNRGETQREKNAKKISVYRKRMKKRLIAYKGGKCKKCGYDKDVPGAYVFHHLDPSIKKFGLSTANFGVGKKKLFAEADKCDLYCCRCHAEIHHEMQLEKSN